MKLKDRIRGYLPVVVDVETGGFNENSDALLEICAIIIGLDDNESLFQRPHFIFILHLLRVLILNHQH